MAKDKKPARLDLRGLPLKAIIAQVNAKYGANTLALASEALGYEVSCISTGAYALDLGLGGGIPRGRITQIHGNYSTLKSTICYRTIANFQQAYPEGVPFFDDGEKSFVPSYAQSLGVDLDRLILINRDSGEQAVDVLSEVVDIGDRDVLAVVDSLASLTPTAEIEASMDQNFQGLHPRLVNRMMRVLTAGIKRSMYDTSGAMTTVLVTNQIREKIGVVYGNPETTPGGRGKDFAYAVMVKFNSSPSDRLMEKVTRNGIEREIRIGQRVRFTVLKNKVSASQFEEGEFEYYQRAHKDHSAHSFNNEEVLFKYGVFYGIIASGGEYRYKDVAFKSEAHFKKAMIKRPKMCARIYEKILAAMLAEESEGIAPHVEEVEATTAKPVKVS